MIQSAARIAIALLLLGGIIFALTQHGRQIPAHKYHAAGFIGGAALEAALIWLAGGWE